MTRTSLGSRKLPVVALLVILVSVGACSSSGDPGSNSDPTYVGSGGPIVPDFSGEPDAGPGTAVPSPSPTPDNAFTHLGMLTIAGPNGDSVDTALSVGEPAGFADAAVPPDAVNTCFGWNQSVVQANSVVIPGQLSVTYHGNVAQLVAITDAVVQRFTTYNPQLTNGDEAGTVAIQDPGGGRWDLCSAGEDGWMTDFNPGQTITVDVWMLLRIKTNLHPDFTEADRTSLATSINAFAADMIGNIGRDNKITVSGSHAVECADQETDNAEAIPALFLYATPPQRFKEVDAYGNVHLYACKAP